MRIFLLISFLFCFASCTKNFVTAVDKKSTEVAKPEYISGLPYIVGKELRPEWDTELIKNARSITNFSFLNQKGEPITHKNFEHKITVVGFFYSDCPGICPLTTKNLKIVQNRFLNTPRVQLASFSIVPETDTPAKLSTYARRNKIQPDKWSLITGARKDIYNLARDSFGADTFSPKENSAKALKEEDFLHSENVYLLDQNLKLRGIYAGLQQSSVEELARDIEVLLNEAH